MAYWQSHGLLAKPSPAGKTMAYWRSHGLLAKPWPAGKTMAYWRSHGLLAKPWPAGLVQAEPAAGNTSLFAPRGRKGFGRGRKPPEIRALWEEPRRGERNARSAEVLPRSGPCRPIAQLARPSGAV